VSHPDELITVVEMKTSQGMCVTLFPGLRSPEELTRAAEVAMSRNPGISVVGIEAFYLLRDRMCIEAREQFDWFSGRLWSGNTVFFGEDAEDCALRLMVMRHLEKGRSEPPS
jgi:hypothetical protein